MQIREKRNKILIIAITIIMLFNFILPNFVFAEDDTTIGELEDNEIAGLLFRPIAKLVVGLGDLAIELLQEFLLDGSKIEVKGNYNDGYYCPIYIGPAAIFTGQIPRLRC